MTATSIQLFKFIFIMLGCVVSTFFIQIYDDDDDDDDSRSLEIAPIDTASTSSY